jgi:hypothetical protein
LFTVISEVVLGDVIEILFCEIRKLLAQTLPHYLRKLGPPGRTPSRMRALPE